MATKKSSAKSKTAKKVTKKTVDTTSSSVAAASGILFAGAAVVILGIIQGQDNIKLLLVGFGAAMLVFGGALLGNAAKK